MKHALNLNALERIGQALRRVNPTIDIDRFKTTALDGLDQLELKARVHHIITALHQIMPSNFHEAARILQAIPPIWDKGDPNDPYRGFAAWPLIDYVGVYGLNSPETALDALERLTQMFSAEFAIRPFLSNFYHLTYSRLESWCSHPNEHVRRLASEGTRPRLPWGRRVQRLLEDPQPGLDLLSKLVDDPSLYVRRSVANHLNDISIDHPEPVMALCEKWARDPSAQRQWIIKHALRTLVKDGQPGVYALLGFDQADKVKARLVLTTTNVKSGGNLCFSIQVVNTDSKPKRVVLDYAIHFVRKSSKTSRKVFKLRNLNLAPNETRTIEKKHSFKPITTRKYYLGEHRLEVTLNGTTVTGKVFHLI